MRRIRRFDARPGCIKSWSARLSAAAYLTDLAARRQRSMVEGARIAGERLGVSHPGERQRERVKA
jgi:hypothetical protein